MSTEEKKKSKGYDRVGFYKYAVTGNYTSHKKGLTSDQINYLQSLKEGDRLILYVNENNKIYENEPDIAMCTLIPTQTNKGEENA